MTDPSELKIHLAHEDATLEVGARLGAALSANIGSVVYLTGDLGAGKTTLSRGVLTGFGHSGSVKSPTFTLVEPYVFPHCRVYHFDLYRLGDPEELEYMGYREYFGDDCICLIEWPGRGEGFLPPPDLELDLRPEKTDSLPANQPSTHQPAHQPIGRSLKMSAYSKIGQKILAEIAGPE